MQKEYENDVKGLKNPFLTDNCIVNILVIICLFLFPLFFSFYIVSIHSNMLISKNMSYVLLGLSILTIIILVICFVNKKVNNNKFKKKFKIILTSIFIFYISCAIAILGLLYGPNAKFRDWLITTAMETMSHKYLAQWFYSSEEIKLCLDNNKVVESGESTNPDMIVIQIPDYNNIVYKNKYEKEILTKDSQDQIYKIININRDGMKGKLAVVYDASKLKLITAKNMGNDNNIHTGQYLVTMAKENNALVAINASGFIDPGYNSWGGVPQGLVIVDGKLVVNNKRYRTAGGVIGITYDNKLILGKMTVQQAMNSNLKYAVQFGPFLIVNGKASYIKGNGGGGKAPRTVIGQREDGIILLLVIDGRNPGHSRGADYSDVTQIMLDYGAVNAANLDGGTSSAMAEKGVLITRPINSSYVEKTRPIPNAWAVINE